MVNNKKIFWIIFSVFILTRLLFINNYFWFDEGGWAIEAKDFDGLSYTPQHIPHFPLGTIIYSFSYKTLHNIIGETASIRIVPFIFGVGQFLLIYLLCKKLYNIKTALIAVGIYTISFWAYMSNIMVDQDGSIISFLILLIFYLHTYLYDKNIKWYIIPIIGLLLALLGMCRLVLPLILFFVMVLNMFWKKKTVDYGYRIYTIFAIYSIFFVFFDVIILQYNYEFYSKLFWHSFTAGSRKYNIRQVMLFGYSFFIFMVMFFVPFLHKKTYRKKNILFLFFILIYVFIIAGKTLDPGRYLMPLIPFLVIILANYLTKIPEKYTSFIKAGIPMLIIFLIVNLFTIFYIPNGISDYLKPNNLLNMETAFTLVGSSIRPFYLSNAIVFWMISLSLIGISMLIIYFDNHIARYILFGIFLTFNIFLIIMYPLQNSISDEGSNMIDFCKHNLDLNKTFYVDYPNFEAVEYYLNVGVIKQPKINSFTNGNDFTQLSQDLNISNGYVYILNYIGNNNNFKNIVFNKCTILYENIGQIYWCGE